MLPVNGQSLVVLAGIQYRLYVSLVRQIASLQTAAQYHFAAIVRGQQGLHRQAQLLTQHLQGELSGTQGIIHIGKPLGVQHQGQRLPAG